MRQAKQEPTQFTMDVAKAGALCLPQSAFRLRASVAKDKAMTKQEAAEWRDNVRQRMDKVRNDPALLASPIQRGKQLEELDIEHEQALEAWQNAIT